MRCIFFSTVKILFLCSLSDSKHLIWEGLTFCMPCLITLFERKKRNTMSSFPFKETTSSISFQREVLSTLKPLRAAFWLAMITRKERKKSYVGSETPPTSTKEKKHFGPKYRVSTRHTSTPTRTEKEEKHVWKTPQQASTQQGDDY